MAVADGENTRPEISQKMVQRQNGQPSDVEGRFVVHPAILRYERVIPSHGYFGQSACAAGLEHGSRQPLGTETIQPGPIVFTERQKMVKGNRSVVSSWASCVVGDGDPFAK